MTNKIDEMEKEKTPTIKDMFINCSIEDAVSRIELAELNGYFGSYTCTNGWFLRKRFLRKSYCGFKASDVIWVYPKQTKQSAVVILVPIPLGSYYNIVCKLSNGEEITLSNNECTKQGEKIPAKCDDILQQLQLLIPWAIFGYSEYLKECWEKHWNIFLRVHNERLAKIQEGLKNGSIIVLPNGSLAVSPTFTLPTIAMKFEQTSKGKLERVYYQTESQQTT